MHSLWWQASSSVCRRPSLRSPITRALLNPCIRNPSLQLSRRPFQCTTPCFKKNPKASPHVQKIEPPPKKNESHPSEASPGLNAGGLNDVIMNKGNIVVGSLVGACVGMFVYTEYCKAGSRTGSGPKSQANPKSVEKLQALDKNFVHSLRNWKEGRHYTIVTSAFMHTNIAHLYCNMLGLWSFGPSMVVTFGVPSFLLLYFGSIVTGALFQNSVWISKGRENASGVGASGGVLGIVAAVACLVPKSQITLFWVPMQIRLGMAVAVGVSVLGLANESFLPSIGHADHLGGLAFGVLWYLVAVRRGRINPGTELRKWL